MIRSKFDVINTSYQERRNKTEVYPVKNLEINSFNKPKNHIFVILLFIGLPVVFLFIPFLFPSLFSTTPSSNQLENDLVSENNASIDLFMPYYIGVQLTDVERDLFNSNYGYTVVYVSYPEEYGYVGWVQNGTVIYTDPEPNTAISKSAFITLYVYQENDYYYTNQDTILFRIIITQIGNNVKIRSTPTTQNGNSNKIGNVHTGEEYDVYETTINDGYTWYRIGTDMWIATDGTWTDIISY